MNIRVVIQRGDDGFFSAHCPSLKSCWSQGRTREEALENIREAITLFLDSPRSATKKNEMEEEVELSL